MITLRRRAIDPKIWESPHFKRLVILDRLIFVGLITTADDYGKLNGEEAIVRSRIFPYDDISLEEIEKSLKKLVDERMVQRYEVDGNKYIKIIKWDEYQTFRGCHKAKSCIPDPHETAPDLHQSCTDDAPQLHQPAPSLQRSGAKVKRSKVKIINKETKYLNRDREITKNVDKSGENVNVNDFNKISFNDFKPKTKEDCLAIELAEKLKNKKDLGYYLMLSHKLPESIIRRILGIVMETPKENIRKTYAHLFSFLAEQQLEGKCKTKN